MIAITIIILVLWASSIVFLDRSHRTTLNDTIGLYENALVWERTRVAELIAQVQASAQGLQYYPTIGPTPADSGPVLKRLADETGLIEVEFDPDNDDLFDMVP